MMRVLVQAIEHVRPYYTAVIQRNVVPLHLQNTREGSNAT